MPKFAGILDPIKLSRKNNAAEILECLIELKAYVFDTYDKGLKRQFIGQDFDARRLEKHFAASSTEKLNGCIYRHNPILKNEIQNYLSSYIEDTIEEDLYFKKNAFSLEQESLLLNEGRQKNLQTTFEKTMSNLTKKERFFEGEIYTFRTRCSESDYLNYMTMWALNWHKSQMLMDYLQYGNPLKTEPRQQFLEIWKDFEINYRFAQYLNGNTPKTYSLNYVKNNKNRYPGIFETPFDCEFFFYCVAKYPNIQKRSYSIIYQWFLAQNLIREYRGSKKIFQDFINENFTTVSKIEKQIDRDTGKEYKFLKKCKLEFDNLFLSTD